MEAIKDLLNVDISSFFLLIFTVLLGFVSIVTIVEKGWLIIHKPTSWFKNRNIDHELLTKTIQDLTELHNKHEEDTKQSIRHDEMIREDLQALATTVNNISSKLETMQEKIDATEMAKLKDKILGYYRKYKDVGEWQKFESDVFWGLYDRYISHGGNSFVQNDIEPTMRNLKIIDE